MKNRRVNPLKFCLCCQQLVSSSTEYRHRQLRAPPRLKATSLYRNRHEATRPRQHPHCSTSNALPVDVEAGSVDRDTYVTDAPDSAWTHDQTDDVGDRTEIDGMDLVNNTMMNAARDSNIVFRMGDYESDCSSDRDVRLDMNDAAQDIEDSHWGTSGLELWDELGESFERDLATIADSLNERDKLILRAFALKIRNHLTDDTFEQLPFVFKSDPLPSWKETRSRAAFLSGLDPVLYDCCPNSCCCYVGPHASLDRCPFCDTARYDSKQRPRKVFVHIPLIPRLVALYRQPNYAKLMKYRAEHVHSSDTHDILDGSVYLNLLRKRVVVDKEMPHTYFSDPRDVALGLSTDGFAPFRRRNSTAWPLIIFNYNLPPELRFHKSYEFSLGVIPGPKKPKDIDSFLWPVTEELLKLAVGVRAFDILESSVFALHAYPIIVFGDIPAISMLMNMKGHNGFSPCRTCKITGVLMPAQGAKTYYVPLDRSKHPEVRHSPSAIKRYDAHNLPLRMHSEMLAQAREVQAAPTQTKSGHLSKLYGIKGVPVLSYLPSLSFPSSFPYDFMHVVWENVIPNLVLLWTGEFKGLDEGRESYHLKKDVWEAIGEACSASSATLPSSFCSSPPNLAGDRSSCTADSWSFWALYLGPVLLRRKFSKPKYHDHFVDLVKLLHICLQFELSKGDVQTLRNGFVQWVEKYEEYYYQLNPDRLSTCTLTVHALLHIADSIDATGPVWTSWAFPTERFCGRLKGAIKSRRFPYASLAQYLLDDARLNQIQLLHNMTEELRLHRSQSTIVPGQLTNTAYESCVLLPPRHVGAVEALAKGKILAALATRFDATVSAIRRHVLLDRVVQFGKLRHVDGDTMLASALIKPQQDMRDASFVRYEAFVDKYARHRSRKPEYETKTYFGQLCHIFVVELPVVESLGWLEPSTIFLAAVKTCITDTYDSLGMHYYSKLGPLEIVDVACIQCLVGRVRNGGLWALVDRSNHVDSGYDVEDAD